MPLIERLRVLDLSRVLAGPLCTMILGDLGADVLKIERPGSGDDTRGWGPPFDARGESAYFLSVNRNKLSVAADLDRREDADLIRSLVEGADVVVDNFRRGMLERRGIEPARFLEQHPELIWCTITGFGPESDRPGYDFVVQAERGWMSVTGEPDGPPLKSGIAFADILAGKDAAIAILGALAGQSRRLLPVAERRIWISLADSAAAALINVAQNALVSGRDARRWGNAHPNLAPYQLFDTADRPMVVAVGSDAQWRACAVALELDSLAGDARFATNAGRLVHRDDLVRSLAEQLRTRPSGEWIARLDRAGVPCGVVKTVLETLDEIQASPLTGVAPSVPGSVRLPPPRLDEHGTVVRARGWAAFE
jgi:crotonobetainyl-CoA:carnitine CoA-transferase CaiB-like acyl-CoA transferase